MSSYLVKLARAARKNPTPAEAKLWGYLRDRRLENTKFVRQKVLGRYRPDFYCHEAKLIIELDGSSHNTPEAQAYDLERTKNLEAQDLTVLRLTNHQVLHHLPAVLQTIRQALQNPAKPTTTQTLPPRGEGVSFADG